ncbi:MAG: pilus assembly protein [Coriobacteriales bacterium]|jgi:hypothetical protein|nr:pilus assembly protein [Coriobacteriales bacterium]
MRIREKSGQTTVEAAYLIPVLLLLILLLLQPMILLYNRMVMENAAAEGCRLLATSYTQGASQEKYEGYIKRRLAAIPPVDLFHLRTGGRGWEIDMEGDEGSVEVSVHIVNRLKPLPLLGWGAELLRMTDAQHNLVQEVRVTMPTQPDWVAGSGGNDPEGWVNAYD